jgi:hypothetical protein
MRPVAFDVPVEAAFDYLVEPRNRPAWQSSLRRVEQVSGEPRVGQTWVDVTGPGLRPAMATTALDRPHLWSERGTWRGVEATLTLRFDTAPGGCRVTAEVSVGGRPAWRLVGPLVERVAALAVPRDLRRASRLLSARATGH